MNFKLFAYLFVFAVECNSIYAAAKKITASINNDTESSALSEKEDISKILTTSTDPDTILDAAKKEAEIVQGQPKVEVDAKGLSTFQRLKQKVAPITDWVKKNRTKIEIGAATASTAIIGTLIYNLTKANSELNDFKAPERTKINDQIKNFSQAQLKNKIAELEKNKDAISQFHKDILEERLSGLEKQEQLQKAQDDEKAINELAREYKRDLPKHGISIDEMLTHPDLSDKQRKALKKAKTLK